MAGCVRPVNQQRGIEVATMDACLPLLQSWKFIGQSICFDGCVLVSVMGMIHLIVESGASPWGFEKPGSRIFD